MRRIGSRVVKEARIKAAKDRIFGAQENMPGDRFFQRNLEGHQLKQMYFPSRFSLQDFRVDEYFEMQAERFAPREVHPSMPQLEATLHRIAKNRKKIEEFFNTKLKIDTPEGRQIFQDNPTLQDLHGLLRHLEARPQLQALESSQQGHTEEDAMEAAASSLHLTPTSTLTSRPSSTSTFQPSAEELEESDRRQLATLATQLRDAMPRDEFRTLEAQLLQLKSAEEVRDVLLEQVKAHGIVPDYSSLTLMIENEGGNVAKSAGRQEEATSETDADAPDATGTDDEYGLVDLSVTDAAPLSVPPLFAPKRLSSVLAASKGEMHAEKMRRAKGREKGEEAVKRFLNGQGPVTQYLKRRHRFIEPMYRRRRLKWLEKMQANRIKTKDLQLNEYWPLHPDQKEKWPTNMGSVTVKWPSPYH